MRRYETVRTWFIFTELKLNVLATFFIEIVNRSKWLFDHIFIIGGTYVPWILTKSSLGEAPPHCTEIDFALSFGGVMVKMIDLSKTGTRDFFDIILDQKNAQELYLLPKSCYKSTTRLHFSLKWANFFIRFG